MVPFRYTAEMTGQQSDMQKITKGKTWVFTLKLREQARVVLVANIDVDRGLVNGAVGTVMGFSQATGSAAADVHRWPRVKFDGVPGEVRCCCVRVVCACVVNECVHVLCVCSCHVCVACGVHGCGLRVSTCVMLAYVVCKCVLIPRACRTQREGLSQGNIARSCSLFAR